MNNEQREKIRLKQRVEGWVTDHLTQKKYQNLNGLRDKVIRELADSISLQYDQNREDVKAFLNKNIQNFEFESEYTTADKEVALVLKEYLGGQNPFKQKQGRKRNTERNWAALYALYITGKEHAVTEQFFHGKASDFRNSIKSMTEKGTIEDALRMIKAYDDDEGVVASPETENTLGRKQFNDWWDKNNSVNRIKWLKENIKKGK
ncbi:hypothetical protein [Shewanella halifaxensis]|uniref:hypothetical protein n=1 Tax=Shewanella halifaxensis TaxID=271098 RepID=UPI000D592659|nr:hypothetical protein [Shewanella halifaxensis]